MADWILMRFAARFLAIVFMIVILVGFVTGSRHVMDWPQDWRGQILIVAFVASILSELVF
jgi:hypothetical protein